MFKSAYRSMLSKSNMTSEEKEWSMVMEFPGFVTYRVSVILISYILFLLSGVLLKAGGFRIVNNTCFLLFLIFLGVDFLNLTDFFVSKTVLFKRLDDFLYFNLYTKKGRAITRQQFKKIKRTAPNLYKQLKVQKVAGMCYNVSLLLITKVLQKGSIIFLAVHDSSPTDHKNTDYHMHVLYANDGYVFDTDSCLQIPLDVYISINKASIFGEFSFEEIGDDLDEFVDKLHPRLIAWCKEHNVFLWREFPVVE